MKQDVTDDSEVPLVAGLSAILHISYETYRRRTISGDYTLLKVRKAGRKLWVTMDSLKAQREQEYLQGK